MVKLVGVKSEVVKEFEDVHKCWSMLELLEINPFYCYTDFIEEVKYMSENNCPYEFMDDIGNEWMLGVPMPPRPIIRSK